MRWALLVWRSRDFIHLISISSFLNAACRARTEIEESTLEASYIVVASA